MYRYRTVLSILIILSVLSMIVALHFGAVSISWHKDFAFITHTQALPGNVALVILKLRAPRIATAFCIGALLALSGVLMQVLLGNPLADPYILGVSSGSALFAIFAMLLGLSLFFVHVFAFVGALLAIFLVVLLAGKHCLPEKVLLIGVVLATGFAALMSFILVIAPSRVLHGMLYWLLGDLSFAHWPWTAVVILLLGLLPALRFAKALNVLAHGDQYAKSLGLACRRLRLQILLLSSLLTAVAVSDVGAIGFVGLIVPHAIRLLVGHDHRHVIPLSVLCGGIVLTIADTIARTAFAPMQLPVGMITAFVGVPSFLFLLLRRHTNRGQAY